MFVEVSSGVCVREQECPRPMLVCESVFKRFILSFIYMSVCLSMLEYTPSRGPGSAGAGAGVKGSCELSNDRYWKLNFCIL